MGLINARARAAAQQQPNARQLDADDDAPAMPGAGQGTLVFLSDRDLLVLLSAAAAERGIPLAE